jgi:hypothetical protein
MNELKNALQKALSTAAGVGGDFLPTPLATEFIDLVREKTFCRQVFRVQKMPNKVWDFPKILGGPKVYYEATEGTAAIETSVTTGTIRLTAKKFIAQIKASMELFEDANADFDAIIRDHFAAGMAEAEEETFIVGDRSHTASAMTEGAATEVNWYVKDHRLAWNGLLTLAGDIVGTLSMGNRAANRVDASGAAISTTLIRQMLYNLGKYGRNYSNLILILNPWSSNQLLDDTKLVTLEKYGPKATIFTGEIGKLYGKITVLTSDFCTDGYGVLTHKGNAIVGDRRLVKMKSEEIIENDQKRIVISQRADMQVEYQDALVQIYDLDQPSTWS